MENGKQTLERLYTLGLTGELEKLWREEQNQSILGRIASQHRNLYKVLVEEGELLATVAGKLQYQLEDKGEYPAVGDWVLCTSLDRENGVIERILPRKTVISRKVAGNRSDTQILATNVDHIFIATSLNQDFNLRRLERYINIAWESGAMPTIILTKLDLCEQQEERLRELEEVAIGIDMISTSSVTGEGIEAIRNKIKVGETVVFIGSSGVGKSSLINKLLGVDQQEVSAIGEHDRGRHTTTYREVFILPGGGVVIDTPGMRELQLSSGDLDATFKDIEELMLSCQFSDCTHHSEPRCAIQMAIKEGNLSKERYNSYIKLKKELANAEMRKAQKDRSRSRGQKQNKPRQKNLKAE